jgi:DNA-binding response OmpR family regulator
LSISHSVLLVEDDPLLRHGTVAMIGGRGHGVVAAATVGEGMECLAGSPTRSLLDIDLPDGVGTTMLRRIRDEHLPIRVAILSGSGDPALMAEVKSLNSDAMFRKPPEWDAVMDWVAQ